ncbi:MAG: cyanophycin synthetase [Myxococcota bacterium]
MKILETRVYRGPNLYGYRPVIRLTVDLEELEEWPSARIPGFVPRLVAAIPSLREHTCSYGERGGFVKRLEEGTWMGHILEHSSLELQCLAGTPVTYGKARSVPDKPGQYYVIYSYEEERVGIEAGKIAFELLRSLLPADLPSHRAEPFDLVAEQERLAKLAEKLALGPSTRSLVDEARKRGIPWLRLNDQSLVQFGHGKNQKRIQATVTSETRHIAVEIAQDKELTNKLLGDCGVPVPKSVLVRDEEEAVRAARDIGYPVVVKPYNLSHGRGVALDLRDEAAVREAFKHCFELTDYILVETFLTGRDYRILVVNGEIVAVSERVPGHVVGDGVHTVRQLVDLVNADPRRGVGHEKILTRIEIDHQAERLLKAAGRTLDSVLAAGEVLHLRSTANLSTGGTAIDRTDVIHPENADVARRAARVVGLDVAGIDLIAPDVTRPVRETGGGIVEVNAAPGFRMHVAPTQGRPRNVAGPVMDMLFPSGSNGRIPLIAITGTNGKTTTSRMVAHILKMSGKRVGLTTTDGIYVDGERILTGDMTGPWSARVVLRDPTVEAAVLETARGGILREGLGFSRCEVGAVLNVSNDHLGLRGVNTLEELAFVKRLVLEVVRDDGVSVMNADDPLVVAMAPEAEGRHVWFSMDPENEVVQKHVAEGGWAAVVEKGVNGDMLTLYKGEQQIPLVWSHLVPATLEGRATFNVQNALAAAAIAMAAGVSLEHVRQGLRTFDTTFFQAPGRLNVFDKHRFKVIVDYAHNPAAMRAMAETVRRLKRGRAIGVIGAAGDRRDQDIRELGQIAAGAFDHLYVREDDDRRGRAPGEAAALLKEGAVAGGADPERVHTVLGEVEACEAAMRLAEPDDLVVLFADDITAVWKQVIYFGKEA